MTVSPAIALAKSNNVLTWLDPLGGHKGFYNKVPRELRIHRGREPLKYGTVSALERRASKQGAIAGRGPGGEQGTPKDRRWERGSG